MKTNKTNLFILKRLDRRRHDHRNSNQFFFSLFILKRKTEIFLNDNKIIQNQKSRRRKDIKRDKIALTIISNQTSTMLKLSFYTFETRQIVFLLNAFIH